MPEVVTFTYRIILTLTTFLSTGVLNRELSRTQPPVSKLSEKVSTLHTLQKFTGVVENLIMKSESKKYS